MVGSRIPMNDLTLSRLTVTSTLQENNIDRTRRVPEEKEDEEGERSVY